MWPLLPRRAGAPRSCREPSSSTAAPSPSQELCTAAVPCDTTSTGGLSPRAWCGSRPGRRATAVSGCATKDAKRRACMGFNPNADKSASVTKGRSCTHSTPSTSVNAGRNSDKAVLHYPGPKGIHRGTSARTAHKLWLMTACTTAEPSHPRCTVACGGTQDGLVDDNTVLPQAAR